jgi:2-hydroxycyclohexanecarboxyl-CoA dehydrogenase
VRFDGKTVLVTGGASGIGLATCNRFAESGASVIVADLNAERGAAAAAAIKSSGGNARFLQMDVTDISSIKAGADELANASGGLDILVNVAGWDIIEPFIENSASYMDKVVALNFMGPVRVTQALLPLLIASGSGRIVHVASDAGRVGSTGETVYAGAKGGVIALTKSLARELVRHNVRVNCICPGPTDTPLFANQPEKMREALIRAIPMRRLAKAEEVADGILFFASDYSSFITGQILSVSGGLTMVG